MKKFTITFSLKQLLTSVVAIAVTFSIYSFVSSDKKENIVFDTISVAEANTMFLANKNSEQPFGGEVSGICITPDQFEAMKKLNRDVNASGFRCYFARNASGGDVSIVVGVDLENKDITSHIKLSAAGNFAACPSFCDDNSPITAE